MEHIPERTCICCRNKFPQDRLIRIARNNGEYSVDVRKKSDGRGAYFCGSEECRKKLIKSRALDRAFKEKVGQEVYEMLLASTDKEGF